MDDLPFLRSDSYTTKDKLVLLTARYLDNDNQAAIAEALDLSVASVRQSMRKAGHLDEAVEQTANQALQAAIIEVCEIDRRSMRPQDHKLVAKVAADLVETGATPDEVHRRAKNLALRFRMWPTPGSLDKYWAQLADTARPFAPKRVLR